MSERVKIVITVPVENAEAVRMAMGEAGAGAMGNYSCCSFSNVGDGRFLPNQDANPAIGESGRLETVREERIEVVCKRSSARAVAQAAIDVHPYEEVACDIYPLLDLEEL